VLYMKVIEETVIEGSSQGGESVVKEGVSSAGLVGVGTGRRGGQRVAVGCCELCGRPPPCAGGGGMHLDRLRRQSEPRRRET